MMYCDNCGAKVENRRKFCDNCGAAVRVARPSDYLEAEKKDGSNDEHTPYQPTRPALERKIILVAISFSLFPGLGQIYVGKLFRGVGFLGGTFAIGFFAAGFLERGSKYVAYALFATLGLYLIWGVIDASLLVKRYNKFLDENHRVPKHKEKW